jgi:hypothetical protein
MDLQLAFGAAWSEIHASHARKLNDATVRLFKDHSSACYGIPAIGCIQFDKNGDRSRVPHIRIHQDCSRVFDLHPTRCRLCHFKSISIDDQTKIEKDWRSKACERVKNQKIERAANEFANILAKNDNDVIILSAQVCLSHKFFPLLYWNKLDSNKHNSKQTPFPNRHTKTITDLIPER